MAVKVVTDSGSDITQDEARQLGIPVVSVYLRFGDKAYRDGVDIDADEFYDKLSTSPVSSGMVTLTSMVMSRYVLSRSKPICRLYPLCSTSR